MTDFQQPAEANLLEEPKKPSETLKVITILTFIGSGIAIISQVISFIRAQTLYDQTIAGQGKLDQMPSWLKNFVGSDPVTAARNTLDNRTALLILGLVASVLCIYGAMEMRKLKKNGFFIYLIGELLPFATYYIFVGPMPPFALVFALLIAGLFIFLYVSQLKKMS